ncbi:hypothetical protein AKJ16_DCAP05556 [Drosera capensis]
MGLRRTRCISRASSGLVLSIHGDLMLLWVAGVPGMSDLSLYPIRWAPDNGHAASAVKYSDPHRIHLQG